MTRFFISHASEDKDEIARPIADALISRGHGVWFDEYTLQLGDSLPREIDRGLASCDFGVVVLSAAFFSKQWPQRELDGLVAREASDGAKRILPVWHGVGQADVASFSPMLASRLAVDTSRGLDRVVREIEAAVAPTAGQLPSAVGPPQRSGGAPPRHLNLPPGYETRLNYHLYRIAKEKAARNDHGGYAYPVLVKGPETAIRAFTSEVNAKFGVQTMITSFSDGLGCLEFRYEGEQPPEAIEDVGIKHGLVILQCGNSFMM
jgi:hypothetical protein